MVVYLVYCVEDLMGVFFSFTQAHLFKNKSASKDIMHIEEWFVDEEIKND